MVANVSSKAPVLATVLKQVHNRHGRVGESVDKQGFQDSFSIVEAPAGSCYVDNLFRALGYHTLAN